MVGVIPIECSLLIEYRGRVDPRLPGCPDRFKYLALSNFPTNQNPRRRKTSLPTINPNRSNHHVGLLIADDFSQWRAHLRKILQARPEWKIISEASDGQEAVDKASELQPDV